MRIPLSYGFHNLLTRRLIYLIHSTKLLFRITGSLVISGKLRQRAVPAINLSWSSGIKYIKEYIGVYCGYHVPLMSLIISSVLLPLYFLNLSTHLSKGELIMSLLIFFMAHAYIPRSYQTTDTIPAFLICSSLVINLAL